MMFAEVAVDAPVSPGRTFSYSVPSSFHASCGQLVTVPFGPRRLQGVIFGLTQSPQVAATRDLESADSEVPLLTRTQLLLAQWVSDYYMCSLFEAAQLMLPPGRRARRKTYFTAACEIKDTEPFSLTPLQQRVFEYVTRRDHVVEKRIVAALGTAASRSLKILERKGLLVRSYRRSPPTARPKFLRMLKLSGSCNGVDLGRAPRQAAFREWLVEEGEPIVLSKARKEYGVSVVNALVEKGVVNLYDVRVERDPMAGANVLPRPPAILTMTQEKAAAEIKAAIIGGGRHQKGFLLEGVTGSGKTEVYLEAVRHCIQLGKKAIVLVPEIALTHQTIERFSSRFPGQVGVIHSGLTMGQRFDQWHKVQEGAYAMVVGSRGAIFAPQSDLGLIVLDEEHEWSYKQSDIAPRYHARDVAMKLAKLTGAVLILGSATPALESHYKALKGELRPLRLPTRVVAGDDYARQASGGGAMASVVTVDMRRELREGHTDIFSRVLQGALQRSIDGGSQAILFLNRRGSASYLQCRGCGHTLKCRHCEIPSAYHKDQGFLLCHYCGSRRKPPTQCPSCNSYRLTYYGIGTKAVVDEVERSFPNAAVLRWDRDAISGPGDHQGLLERFRSGQAQVLVGTQMVAKGLHFPDVTLVGVVLADVGLNVHDFRAGERAFQLMCQVAGRAGRGPRRGRVIIQTYQPENYAIRAAVTQDYRRFFLQEIKHRRGQGDPPYAHLIKLAYTHTNDALCEREASRLAFELREERDASGHSEVDVLGPTPSYPQRLRGRYHWQLVLRGSQPRVLLKRVSMPHGWTIDVDPVGPA